MIAVDAISTGLQVGGHLTSFNPSSPTSDQRQISPCNINAYSTPEVKRIKGMITQGEFS